MEVDIQYYCSKCDKDFVKTWRKKQWFQDYSAKCKCGRIIWYNGRPPSFKDTTPPLWLRRWDDRGK